MNKLITILLSLVLSEVSFADSLTGKIIKITDGDTIHVLQDNHAKEKSG